MASEGNIEMENGVGVGLLKQLNIDDGASIEDGMIRDADEQEVLESTTAEHYMHGDRVIQKVHTDSDSQETDRDTNTKLIAQNDVLTDDDDVRVLNRLNAEEQANTDMFLHTKESDKSDGKMVKTNSSIKQRLFTDPIFRSKVLRTAILWWSMFVLGWRSSLTGPTFPDLRQIIGKDLATASWILTAKSGGGLIGAAAGGALYDRYNGPGLFVTIGVGFAATTGVIPWCSHFIAMVSAHVVSGAFSVALDMATNTDVIRLWRENPGPVVQFAHFGFSIGAILSPLASEPFLSKPLSYASPNVSLSANSRNAIVQTTTWRHGISANETTAIVTDDTLGGATNMSLDRTIYLNSDLSNLNHSFVTNDDVLIYGDTNIYIAYLISAGISLTLVLLFIVEHFFSGSTHLSKTPTVCNEKDFGKKAGKAYDLSTAYKVVFTMLMSLMLMVYIIIERTYTSFLMTFVISRLYWSKAGGSSATSMFWLTLAAGRLLSVYTLKRFKLGLVLISNMIVIVMGVSLFWLSTYLGNTVLGWVSIALVGLGMSLVFGCAFSWLSDNVVPVRGKISSVLYIVFSIGAMTFPLLTGYLMYEVSYDWFLYLMMILAVVMLAIFVFVEILFKYAK